MMNMKKAPKKGMMSAGYKDGGKVMKAEKAMMAMKKAPKKMMMANGGKVKMADGGKAFKPCAGCPAPKKCAAMGKCMKGGK